MSQQDGHAVVAFRRGHDVSQAVAVQVGRRDSIGAQIWRCGWRGRRSREGAAASSPQHAHHMIDVIGSRDIGQPVTVDVTYSHRIGADSR